MLYIQDQGGDENWHLYSVDLDSGNTIDLSPFDNTQAQMMAQSERVPGVVIVGMNDRDPQWHDVYSVDLATGKRTLLMENDGFASFLVDNDLNVRLATKPTPAVAWRFFYAVLIPGSLCLKLSLRTCRRQRYWDSMRITRGSTCSTAATATRRHWCT